MRSDEISLGWSQFYFLRDSRTLMFWDPRIRSFDKILC